MKSINEKVVLNKTSDLDKSRSVGAYRWPTLQKGRFRFDSSFKLKSNRRTAKSRKNRRIISHLNSLSDCSSYFPLKKEIPKQEHQNIHESIIRTSKKERKIEQSLVLLSISMEI